MVMVGSTMQQVRAISACSTEKPPILDCIRSALLAAESFLSRIVWHPVRKYETNMRPMPQPVLLGPGFAKAARADWGLEIVGLSISRLTPGVLQKGG